MINNKSLFKNISIFFCLIPMLFLSLLCLIPTNKQSVYAVTSDVVVEDFAFNGSNFIVGVMGYNNTSTFDRYYFANISISFSLSNGVYSSYMSYRCSGNNLGTSQATTTYNTSSVDNIALEEQRVKAPLSTTYGFYYRVVRNGSLTKSINRVRFHSTSINTCRNFVTYYDVYGNYIEFSFEMYISQVVGDFSTSFLLSDRTYYINTEHLEGNEYYESGYTSGYQAGLEDGSNTGYQNGYNNGYNVGYAGGYEVGVGAGNNYSFSSLLGAVVDAPVKAFTSLLNFDIFGVNILALVTGLLSVGIIVVIVKLCLGGR